MNKFLIVALLVSRLAFAAVPLTEPISGQVAFWTMDDAAKAALNECSTKSDKFEYGGVILELDGKFYYTSAISSKSDREIGTFRIAYYKGSKVVGLYHTHPHGYFSDIFSAADVKFADEKGWISYVGVLGGAKMRIIRYVPGETPKIIKKEIMSDGLVSEGELVNAT